VRLDQIVGNVLALSRVERQQAAAEAIDIGALTLTLAQSHKTRGASLQLTFTCEVNPAEISLAIAAQQWELLCNNLLDNALRFSRPGGAIHLRLVQAEGTTTLEVTDEGVGIEPDLLPKIFDRFFTTASPATGERGTGLGLAIAKSIVESHHGSITVHPNVPRGTIFRAVFR
jgi:signal transduction histidine kinase